MKTKMKGNEIIKEYVKENGINVKMKGAGRKHGTNVEKRWRRQR